MEQENIRFEKSDLPPDTIKVKVGKDGASLMPPETLTVHIDYSRREFTEHSWMHDVPDNTGKCNTEISFDMDADSFYNVFDGGAHYNAQKLAASVMPVLSTLPFKVEFLVVRQTAWYSYSRNVRFFHSLRFFRLSKRII